MKSNYKHPLYLALSLALTALTPLSAHALDLNGYTTPNDAACWTDPSCSLPRGGDSDVMTVYNPNGTIFQQIFAFGNEELNNIYYFDPASVPVDPSQFGNYTSLYNYQIDLDLLVQKRGRSSRYYLILHFQKQKSAGKWCHLDYIQSSHRSLLLVAMNMMDQSSRLHH